MTKDRFSTIRVLDTALFVGSIEEAVAVIIESIVRGERYNRCISATGAHGMVLATREPEFRQVLADCYMNLPDGMPGVWIGKLKGAKAMRRCYGPEVFSVMMRRSASNSINHFFCGGNMGVAEKLKEAVGEKFNNRHVSGTYFPPFLPVEDYDYPAIAKIINEAKADIVWIGLSTPKQEKFAWHLANHTDVCYIISVGAAFDFHTDRLRQAPHFLQRAGLEWFFRLILEPKRLFRRYFEIVPLFIFYNMREVFSGKPKPDGH